MGALLSSLFNFSQPIEKQRDVMLINFEDVEPSEAEKEEYEHLRGVLSQSCAKMATIAQYDGCSQEIQEAITHPNSEIEARAWDTIIPNIKQLELYYSSSLQIVQVFEKIIAKLCGGNVQDNISSMGATTKLFADILCFSYDFDQAKVSKSQIQNDFSYYKRVLSRMKSSSNAKNLFIMPSANANNISLFFAQFCPLTSAISRSCTDMSSKDTTATLRARILELLTKISQMCSSVISNDATGHLSGYCLKVLAGTIVLYDHTDPAGAFVRSSKLNINSLVRLIQTHEKSENNAVFDFITRASINFNAPTTPKNVKALIRPERAAGAKEYPITSMQG